MSGAGALLSFGLSFPPPTRCCCVLSTPVSCMQLSALLFFANDTRPDPPDRRLPGSSSNLRHVPEVFSQPLCYTGPYILGGGKNISDFDNQENITKLL